MTKSNYNTEIFNQLEEAITKLDYTYDQIFNLVKTNGILKDEIKKYKTTLYKDNKKIEELLIEIERLKNNNNKNSSNSSKPSSTNGFKNVVTNNGDRSNKKCGT